MIIVIIQSCAYSLRLLFYTIPATSQKFSSILKVDNYPSGYLFKLESTFSRIFVIPKVITVSLFLFTYL